MKTANYSLKYICQKPYLLPFGQAAADLKKGIELNETGVFLWNCLRETDNEHKLLSMMCDKYMPENKTEINTLKSDLTRFLNELKAFHIFEREEDVMTLPPNYVTKHISIAGINICFHTEPVIFPEEFKAFETNETQNPDITINITHFIPAYHRAGKVILRSDELILMEDDYFYICAYTGSAQPMEWHMSKDGSRCVIYYKKNNQSHESQRIDAKKESSGFKPESGGFIFHAVRMIFLFTAQKRGLFALHSASVLYGGKAWLFSGHSGAGKSTHTRLWQDTFNTPVINGDLNLIGTDKNELYAAGIPWCGTSGIFTENTYPVGGIIMIKQSSRDSVSKLSGEKAALKIMQRMISPCWTDKMLDLNISASQLITRKIPVFELNCTKNPAAAYIMKEAIDRL